MAKGRKPKPILKEDILRAMKMTKSNQSAARYLGISYVITNVMLKVTLMKKLKKLYLIYT